MQTAMALGYDPTQRVLSFKPAPPAARSVNIRKNAQQAKLTTYTSPQAQRRILSSPERVLDAPFMADDYYLNLLDWSKNNVVAVGLDKSVYLWNADTGTIQALDYDLDVGVSSVNWSSNGAYLAVGTASGETQIWDVKSNTKLRSMTGQDCRIGVLSWDRHVVSSGGSNGSIFNHDVRMAKHVVKEMYGHKDDVCGLKWRWDGDLLASGGNDNTVNIWDARSTTPKFAKTAHSGAIKVKTKQIGVISHKLTFFFRLWLGVLGTTICLLLVVVEMIRRFTFGTLLQVSVLILF
jgi:cell division cycle protein 20 (cofactor of APC complex)